jgi:hypothetical protein
MSSVRPELVVSTRGEALVYLAAQVLMVAALVVILTALATPGGSSKALAVSFALGLPAMLARTRLADRMKQRVGSPGAGGWWQGQLDRPSVMRHALRLLVSRG